MSGRYRCGKCGRIGFNSRGCGVTHEPLAEGEREALAAPPPEVEPGELGPWATCVAGDPFCPCVAGVGHGS